MGRRPRTRILRPTFPEPRVNAPIEAATRTERLTIIVTAALLSVLYAVKIHDPDAWWHLATGRWIAQNGSIPSTDPFSFLAGGEPWIYVNWPPDLFYYLVYSVGGLTALVLSKMLVAAGILTTVGVAARNAGARLSAGVATMVVVGVLSQIRFALLRPNAFGGLLLALSCAVLLHWMHKRDRTLWALPVIAALWLPTHGTAILAMGVALVAVVAVALDRDRSGLRTAGLVLGAILLLVAIFPSGRQIVHHLLEMDETSNAITATLEWMRIDYAEPRTWMPGIVVLIAFFGGLWSAWRSRVEEGTAHSWAPLGLAFGAVFLARGYERNLAEALIMASPALALVISELSKRADAHNLGLLSKAAPVGIALALAGGHLAVEPDNALDSRWGFGADESRYPHDTLATLKHLPSGRTINNFGIGGYLIWNEIPGGVFCDGRNIALYTNEIFDNEIMPTMRDEQSLEAVAERHDVTYGLVSSGSLPYRLMMTSGSWTPVFHGESTSLFVRSARQHLVIEAGRPLLPELRWDDEPGWSEAWYDGVLRNPSGAAYLARSIAQSNLEAPNNPVLVQVVPYLNEIAEAVIGRARVYDVELWPPVDAGESQ